MEQYTTQCPNCGTVFRVTEEQLNIANGSVRCGSCMHVFNARDPSNYHTSASPTPSPSEQAEFSKPPTDEEEFDTNDDEDEPDTPSPRSDDDALSDSFLELDNWQDNKSNAFSDDDKLELEGEASGTDEQWAKKLLDEFDDGEPSQPRPDAADNVDLDGSTPGRRANLAASEPEPEHSDENNPELSATDDEVFDFRDKQAYKDEASDSLHSFKAGAHTIEDEETDKKGKTKRDPFDFEGFDDEPDLGDELLEESLSREQLITAIEPAPLEFHITDDRRKWILRGLWVVLIGTGLITLVTQIAWFNFDQKSRDPAYRGWYGAACSLVGCTLPAQQDIKAIKASNLVVRSHPKSSGALVVDAILTNGAAFNQAFPALELIFTNLAGKPVAARRFFPEEYLHGEMTGAKQLPSNRPVHITLEIIDPGRKAVNYSLQLHQI